MHCSIFLYSKSPLPKVDDSDNVPDMMALKDRG